MLDSYDGSVCFFKIESKLLRMCFCNQACLVFSDSTFGVTFDVENPFDTNGLSARWELDEVPGLVLLDRCQFGYV